MDESLPSSKALLERVASAVDQALTDSRHVAGRWAAAAVVLPAVAGLGTGIAGVGLALNDTITGGTRTALVIVAFIATALAAAAAALRAPEQAEAARVRKAQFESLHRWLLVINDDLRSTPQEQEPELVRRALLLLAKIDEVEGVVGPWSGNPPWQARARAAEVMEPT